MSESYGALAQAKPRSSKKAMIAFFFGVLGLGAWIAGAFPAVLFALVAKSDMRKDALLRGRLLANLALLLALVDLVAAPVLLFAVAMYGPFFGNERIAHFHLSGAYAESPASDPAGMFMGQPATFHSLLKRLHEAKEDRSVKAAIVTVNNLQLKLAEMEELRAALIDFTASGKKLFAYCEEAMIPLPVFMTLAAASRLSVAPTALVDIKGLYGEALYLKEGLAKLGVEADVVHIGDYKAAGEMLGRSEPSDAARENMNWLFDGQYQSCIGMLAESRHKTPEEIKALIDKGFFTTDQVFEAGFVDAVEYQDDLVAKVKEEYGAEIYIDNNYKKEPMPEVNAERPLRSSWNVARYFLRLGRPEHTDSIGVIYVEGNILPGYGPPGQAFSGDLRAAFKTAGEDDSIKAVVLRVNSPGGSATASEVIYRAAELFRKKKPLIVSMGPMAASGGYYVSCGAETIFADATTLTGSIGVIGSKMVTADLWKKLGVNWFPYARGANADMFSSQRPYSEQQRDIVTNCMEATYRTFKEHVEAGRGAKLAKKIDEMAGGRVYTGNQALDLGLVDKIGGLEAAIAFAAQTAGLEEDKYTVRAVPEPEDAITLLTAAFLGETPKPHSDLDGEAHTGLEGLKSLAGISAKTPATLALLRELDSCHADAALEILERLQLIQQEGVAMIMPEMVVFQ